jgi:integrase
MATFRIPYLVVKQLASGAYGYYWQPSAALKRDGWDKVNLGFSVRPNDQDKMDAARRKNDEVAAWRNGGAKPREVKKFTRRETMAGLIKHYKASDNFIDLAENTQRTYSSSLTAIEVWASDPKKPGGDGNLPLATITDERVTKLRNALMKPTEKGGAPRHHRAHNILRVLRTLMQYAEKEKMIPKGSNPAKDFGLSTPAPRHQVWEHEDVEAFKASAVKLGYPDLGFAVELALYVGQREADMLKLTGLPPPSTRSNWREVLNLDPETRNRLAGPDGRVMGISLQQGKTKVWVGVPIVGELRAKIEARIADNAKTEPRVMQLLIDDKTGRPWKVRQFIRKFTEVKADAVAKGHAPLAELQFRDLRRTCVVRLGELGLEDGLISAITGHKLASLKKILETYMPRTNKMAARAVVARLGPAPVGAASEQEKAG